MAQLNGKISDRKRQPGRAPRTLKNGRPAIARARQLAEALLESVKQLEPGEVATIRRRNPDDDDEDPTRRARDQR